MLRVEIRKILLNRMTWAAFLISTLLAALAFVIQLYWKNITPYDVVPEFFTLLYMSGIGELLLMLFSTILASLPAACSWHEELLHHALPAVLTRGSRASFYRSKAAAVCLSGFLISLYPFLLNYLFTLVAVARPVYPCISNAFIGNIYHLDYLPFVKILLSYMLFPSLFLNAPVLNMLLHILLIGFWGSGVALLTFSISLYYHKNLVLTAALPSLVLMGCYQLLIALRLSPYIAVYLLLLRAEEPFGPAQYLTLALSLPLPYLLSAILLRLKVTRFRDEL